MNRQAVNPYLPSWEYIPDGEPHVFNGRVYVYGSHDRFNAPIFCVNDYVCWSAPVEDLSDWRCEGVIYRKKQDPKNPLGYHLLFAPDVCQGPDGRYYLYYAFDFLGIMGVAVCDTPAGEYEFLGHIHYADGTLWGRRRGDQLPFDPGVLADDDGRVWLYSGFYNAVPAILTGGHKLRCDGGTVLELEKDMVTIKTEPRVIFPKKGPGAFQGHEFFEASSIRKEGKTYIFVYSSRHKHAGFEVNEELVKFYENFRTERPVGTIRLREIGSKRGDFTVPEPTIAEYENANIFEDAVAYSDTAVVVVSRTGGEGFDIPQSITGPDEYNAQYGGLAQFYDFTTQAEDLDAGKSYLELSNREIAMVDRVCKEFKNVIVVVNSSNAMELGWLDQYDSIKAAVLCGAPGELGFDSLGKILSGEVNPSGHLADTYVYDLLATPTVNNFGGFAYDNYAEVTGSQDNRAMFVNYCEGIYVGYKFYETAAAEGLIDYDKVVQYPFGYGLSYTTFDSSIAAVEDDGEKITLDVAVKNTGDTAGKYVAEIFYEPPYYNGGIEKAAANLVQYAKTEILQPGEAQTLKITFRYEDMASYDSNCIKSANGAYVLEAGDYKINLCSDSHTILDTYVAKVDKDIIYDDAHDGARSTDQMAATNQLTFAQGDVTYLSRADGFANYAEATAVPANHSLSAQALADYASAATFDAAKYDDPNAVMPTTGANNGLKLADLTGVAYDDPKWEQLLDELTVNDLFSLTADGGYHTVGVESIGLSATEDCDGPTGVHSNYNPAAGPSYPGSVMLACTWNQPLAKARGEQIAKECAEINCAGWYAPAMNIHRSAFGGRNFEYYSECGVLSGLTAAAEVSGATENGLICYVKHFAFNDQDNYRQNNICTWLNEQSAREIYLKAFEQPIKAGGMGVMTSMNAVGPVWAGGCKALLTNILRDEWGFHGAVITDAVVSPWYMDGNLAIRTGGTKMLAFNITNEFYRDLNSVGTVTAMRNAAHGTLYALANSFAVTRAVSVPKWVKTTYAVDAVVAIILVAWEVCAICKYRKAKKEDEGTEQ